MHLLGFRFLSPVHFVAGAFCRRRILSAAHSFLDSRFLSPVHSVGGAFCRRRIRFLAAASCRRCILSRWPLERAAITILSYTSTSSSRVTLELFDRFVLGCYSCRVHVGPYLSCPMTAIPIVRCTVPLVGLEWMSTILYSVGTRSTLPCPSSMISLIVKYFSFMGTRIVCMLM